MNIITKIRETVSLDSMHLTRNNSHYKTVGVEFYKNELEKVLQDRSSDCKIWQNNHSREDCDIL